MSASNQNNPVKCVCLDTSFLVSLFLEEVHSPAAERWMIAEEPIVLLSPLNLLEFENALNLRVFFKGLTAGQAAKVRINFQRKLKTGLYTVISENVEVWEQAKQLSLAHSPTPGARTLDIWHVAFAIVQDAKAFGSFDERQRRLASEAGLALNAV